MIRSTIWALAVATMFFLSQSAGLAADDAKTATDDQQVTAEKLKDQVRQTVKIGQEYAAQKRSEYQKLMESKINEWSARIGELEAAAKKAEAGTREQAEQKIQDLKTKKADLEAKLNELKQSSSGAWDQMKVGLENASDALKKAYDQALSNFK